MFFNATKTLVCETILADIDGETLGEFYRFAVPISKYVRFRTDMVDYDTPYSEMFRRARCADLGDSTYLFRMTNEISEFLLERKSLVDFDSELGFCVTESHQFPRPLRHFLQDIAFLDFCDNTWLEFDRGSDFLGLSARNYERLLPILRKRERNAAFEECFAKLRVLKKNDAARFFNVYQFLNEEINLGKCFLSECLRDEAVIAQNRKKTLSEFRYPDLLSAPTQEMLTDSEAEINESFERFYADYRILLGLYEVEFYSEMKPRFPSGVFSLSLYRFAKEK